MSWSSTTELDTVDRAFDRALDDCPDQLFLDFSGERSTYADVAGLVARTADVLSGLGIGVGDRVVTVLDNNVDAVVAMLAATRIGAVAVPVNTGYRGEFLRHQIADSGAEIVIAEPDYAQRVVDVLDGTPAVRSILRRERGGLPGDVGGHVGGEVGAARAVPIAGLEALRAQADGELRAPVATPSDLSCLIYTAGTTGPSKGCMISHNYAVAMAGQYLELTGRRRDNHTFSPLPLFHFNAWSCTVIGSVLLHSSAALAPRFSLSRFWPEIERTGASMTTLLSTILTLVGNAPDSEAAQRCHGRLEIVQGAPFPAELQETWKRRFGVSWTGANCFGLTECCLVTHLPRSEEAKPGTSGRRNDQYDVKIFDDADRELPPGQVGEIAVRPSTPHVMFEGYWNRPEATAAMLRNLWFHTGDLGMFDADGFFHFVDRKKDYLRRGGENISSAEMESAFHRHPDVVEVAVHSVLSDLSEDEVKATVVLRPGAGLTEEDLCRWSVQHLPFFAVPRYIEFRAELPKNPVGRVLKYVLRDEGATASTWDRRTADLEIARR